ncbi:hypothetical protein ELBI_50 [Anabaena phage Elbi]|nr:hypothetical protein ELBI_50 [Anabaena phage Elbi]
MKNEYVEKNIAVVRTTLHRKGVQGVKTQEIREILENNNNDSKDAVQKLLEKYQTAIVDSGENPPESPANETEEEDFKALLKIEPVSAPDETVSMIRSEANNMGLSIPVEHINNIASSVKQSKTFQSDRIKAVKAALVAYIDWSHEQSTNEASEVIQEVERYAVSKAVEFNNNMGVQLSSIFHRAEQDADQFTAQLISALSVN